MKKTVKLLCLMMAILMCVFAFTACGDKKDQKSYADLSMIEGVEIGVEYYGIAFRTGSDMVAKVDAVTAELFADGTIAAIAEKYDQKDSLVPEFVASTDSAPAGDSDFEYIKGKGVMVIGVTDFDPMNYKDKDGKWIGFDTEYIMAKSMLSK